MSYIHVLKSRFKARHGGRKVRGLVIHIEELSLPSRFDFELYERNLGKQETENWSCQKHRPSVKLREILSRTHFRLGMRSKTGQSVRQRFEEKLSITLK